VELTPVAAGSTVDAVLEQLQATVRSGAWAVGERIPGELELTRQLRVSRPVVREAIRALTHIGVLEVRRGDGTYVRSTADPRPLLQRMQRCNVRDVLEVQLAYDVQAAKLAARRRADADIARLTELLAARDSATDPAEFGAADARFHLAIIEITGNPVLIEASRFFAAQLSQAVLDSLSRGSNSVAAQDIREAR
jgi:DNA-binding FadR family transcriptional regulator